MPYINVIEFNLFSMLTACCVFIILLTVSSILIQVLINTLPISCRLLSGIKNSL